MLLYAHVPHSWVMYNDIQLNGLLRACVYKCLLARVKWKRFGSLGFQPPQEIEDEVLKEIEGGVPLLPQVDLSFLQNNQSRVLWQVSENLGVGGGGGGGREGEEIIKPKQTEFAKISRFSPTLLLISVPTFAILLKQPLTEIAKRSNYDNKYLPCPNLFVLGIIWLLPLWRISTDFLVQYPS